MFAGLRLYVILGAAFAALSGGLWLVHTLKQSGRDQLRSEIQTRNQEATDAARKAREAHDLACARNEPGCLRDDWTRDRDR